MNRFSRTIAAAALLGALAACSPSSVSPEQVRLIVNGRYGTRALSLEVADEPDEHSRGLSRRASLPAGQGMIFIFPDESDRVFWMRDTHFPLDMIFLDAHRVIVGIVRRARPDNDDPLSVGRPSRYVIEVEGGFCDRVGLREGDRLEF